jgi:NodT family efflux transporter outer membrane factor (OMF) lipoprotein
VGEDYVTPTPASGETSSWNGRLDGVITAADLDPGVLAEWWTTLDDDTLTSLIGRATEANLDLRTANAQLRKARAQSQLAVAAGTPSIGFGGGAKGTETAAGTGELYSAGLDASWERDVFGAIARGVEAAAADEQAASESRRDVLVTVLSEVALNYVDLRTAQHRRELARTNLQSQQEYLDIARAKFEAGAVTQLDLDQAVSNLETTRSTLPSLDQQLQEIKNRLALLLGKNPGTLNTELAAVRPLPVPDISVAIGVPAQVLRRRPDVRGAERRLAAETARVGVAIADLYPRFSLQGSIGLESLSASNLFDTASRVFTLGAAVQWNLFDGGRIRQQIEIGNADQELALVEYERAILVALEDVQNAVTAFTQERLRFRSLQVASEAATRAARLAEVRYAAGESDYLIVLDTQRTRLSAQDELEQSKGLILANLVRLYKALGGGWDPEAPQAEEKG